MTKQLAAGDQMPSFNIDATGSGSISSQSLAGKKAVIFFYPKDDTPGCTKESIAFSKFKGAFEAIDTVIVGISADTIDKHDKFIAKHNLTITLGSDPELDTLKAFGVWVEKSMYGRSYFGIERSMFLVGKDGKIAQVWRKVKVPGHAEAVLEAASNLG